MNVDFWFDYSSPFAYLAATRVPALAARTGVPIRWRPMLLGAVFREVGQADVPLFAMSEAKRRWFIEDLREWAAWWGVPLRFSPHFPLRTILPLRVTLAHPDPVPLALRLYAAAWAEGLNIAEPGVLVDLGVDPALVREANETQKQVLVDNTRAAVAAGVFGAPSFVVHHDAPGDPPWLFWGQDRLDQLEDAITGVWRPPA